MKGIMLLGTTLTHYLIGSLAPVSRPAPRSPVIIMRNEKKVNLFTRPKRANRDFSIVFVTY